MAHPQLSVIVTTYNWPKALHRVLSGLCAQHYQRLEVIIADDGSLPDTKELVHFWQKKCPFALHHCWQPDEGFQAARIRNKAVAMASHEYCIFIDGDCVPLPHFTAYHAKLAQPGWFVAGNRILLNKQFTAEILKQDWEIEHYSLKKWFIARAGGKCNRFLPLLPLPLGPLRKLYAHRWQGAKTCNLGVWRRDFLQVNGFNEAYVGWGFEDSDLVIRLQNANIRRKNGKFAVPVLHLWHPEADRTHAKENAQRLQATLQNREPL